MRAVLLNLRADAVCVGRAAGQLAGFALFCAGTCGAVSIFF